MPDARENRQGNLLTELEVVLADGSIVNANNQTNTDLFWALKGGTNNFGKLQ